MVDAFCSAKGEQCEALCVKHLNTLDQIGRKTSHEANSGTGLYILVGNLCDSLTLPHSPTSYAEMRSYLSAFAVTPAPASARFT